PVWRRRRRPVPSTGPPAPETCTLSLHDALPISATSRPAPHTGSSAGSLFQLLRDGEPRTRADLVSASGMARSTVAGRIEELLGTDRKSTRLNSSHVKISYAVFCLKKKSECAEQQ